MTKPDIDPLQISILCLRNNQLNCLSPLTNLDKIPTNLLLSSQQGPWEDHLAAKQNKTKQTISCSCNGSGHLLTPPTTATSLHRNSPSARTANAPLDKLFTTVQLVFFPLTLSSEGWKMKPNSHWKLKQSLSDILQWGVREHRLGLKELVPASSSVCMYSVGALGRLPQNVSQWHIGYFELKLLKRWSTQEEPSDPPLCLPESRK